MVKENKKIILGAGILGVGAFFAKLLGAIYRVPLTSVLKSEGIGIYQMVFPVYALLLDFSGAGVPNALSKLIAERPNDKEYFAKKYLSLSIKVFGVLGLLGSIFMIFFSRIISNAQGNALANFSYVTLAPSVFFVCLISCYRGAFQGLGNMKPTAISQVIEQIIKVVFGIILARLFSYELKKSVAGATFAITISEVVAFIVLFVLWKKKIKSNKYNKDFIASPIKPNNVSVKKLLKAVIPITLIGIIMPFSQVIDSFLIINLLKKSFNATVLYGLFSGVCLTIINLPVSVCYGISTISVPTISALEKGKIRSKKINYLLKLTFLISLLFSVCVFIFSRIAVKILFSSLSNYEKTLAVNLIKTCSIVIVLLSLVQTQNSILIACGSYYLPVITLFIGITIKTITEYFLIKIESLNIFGGAIGLIACYFVIFLLNFILIKRIGEKDAVKTHNDRQFNDKKQRFSCPDGGLH